MKILSKKLKNRSIKSRIALALLTQGLVLACLITVTGVIICMASESTVISGSDSVMKVIIVSIAVTMIFALFLSVFVINCILDPIQRLHGNIKSIDPAKPVHFEKTGVREIDELSDAFEDLSDDISEAAAKMFKIVELVNMPMGSFEINYNDNTVSISKTISGFMEHILPGCGSHNITVEDWKGFIGTLRESSSVRNDEGRTEKLYITGDSWKIVKWFRISMITESMKDIGVMIDVTDEIAQKQRLEFERNYDPLTKLLNRQAFLNKAYELMKLNADKIGLMMFADLDDLKFVNDTYGHESGDRYIQTFASFLNKFRERGAVTGRVSGDEFIMFITGFSSHLEARKVFDEVFKGINNVSVTVSEGVLHKMKVSVGLAFYPDDSMDIKMLSKYADYAMYETKNSVKGEVREFNVSSYNKNVFVINMKNILNQLINEKKIRFAFQPMIDTKTGGIYAYEALMRSTMPELKSPDEILQVARSHSKLYQIERLTIDAILCWVNKNMDKLKNAKVFINSVPGQMLVNGDKDDIFGKYSHLLDKVAFEITENDFSDEAGTKNKVNLFRSYGAMIAVDDYGSGYSNESGLSKIEPDFLKIDMSIVRDIDKDNDKQQLVQNVIAYAHKKNIKTVAEGVETYDEMETVVRLGVDYVQGYYFAKPDFELALISKELKRQLLEVSRKTFAGKG